MNLLWNRKRIRAAASDAGSKKENSITEKYVEKVYSSFKSIA